MFANAGTVHVIFKIERPVYPIEKETLIHRVILDKGKTIMISYYLFMVYPFQRLYNIIFLIHPYVVSISFLIILQLHYISRKKSNVGYIFYNISIFGLIRPFVHINCQNVDNYNVYYFLTIFL